MSTKKPLLFFIDEKSKLKLSYEQLIVSLNNYSQFQRYLRQPDLNTYFINLIYGIVNNKTITLLDLDFSDEEIKRFIPTKVEDNIKEQSEKIFNIDDLLLRVKKSTGKIELLTSGTTGKPKKITHAVSKFINSTRIVKQKNRWAYAFNPTHMAGLQVFFQAFCNKNTLVNVFGYSRNAIFETIRNYKLTHISASPSFYRMLLPSSEIFESVYRITLGGEKSSPELLSALKQLFPNAKFNNIYASTEVGTALVSHEDYFIIPEEKFNVIKIIDNELLFHKSLVGEFELESDWYHTGDLVEIISEAPTKFKFLGRKGNLINVGGYDVNPEEITIVLMEYPTIIDARVFGKKNSLIGTLLMAEVKVLDGEKCSEKEILAFLKPKIQSYKIPRIIRIVDRIKISRTGKKVL